MVTVLSLSELGESAERRRRVESFSMRGGSRDAEDDADMQRYIISRVHAYHHCHSPRNTVNPYWESG
jgi:hypothetical protein